MGKDTRKRLAKDDIQVDQRSLQGLQTLGDYAPANSAYSVHTLTNLGNAMEEAHNAEAQAVKVLAELRKAAIDAEWAFHEGILGARVQVVAQYGADAPAVQLLGLKRKSDRRKRAMRQPDAS